MSYRNIYIDDSCLELTVLNDGEHFKLSQFDKHDNLLASVMFTREVAGIICDKLLDNLPFEEDF